MADTRPPWIDQWLGRLLRPPQSLPVTAVERSHGRQHRRLLVMIVCFTMLLGIVLSAVVFSVGLSKLPTLQIVKITFGVPLGIAVLLYLFLYFAFVRGRHHYNDHSWKFRATAQGLRVDCGNGQIYDAPWERWRYASYTYMVAKMQRGVTGLDLVLDGNKIAIDLTRLGNGLALARAVVQQLAVKGGNNDGATRSAAGSGAAG